MMVISVKKENIKDIKNYVPICLLLDIYKVLTKLLTKRLEQAGFRSRYSTTDHIYVVNQLKEKCQ